MGGNKDALDPRRQVLQQAVVQDRRRVGAASLGAAAGAGRPVLGVRSHGGRGAAAVRVGPRSDAEGDLGDGRGRRQRRRPGRVRLPAKPRRGASLGTPGAGRKREQDARLPFSGAGLPELDRRLLGSARRHVFPDLVVLQGDHPRAIFPKPQVIGSRDSSLTLRTKGEERIGREERLRHLRAERHDACARGGRGGEARGEGGRVLQRRSEGSGRGRGKGEEDTRGCGGDGGDQRGLCVAAAAAVVRLGERERKGKKRVSREAWAWEAWARLK